MFSSLAEKISNRRRQWQEKLTRNKVFAIALLVVIILIAGIIFIFGRERSSNTSENLGPSVQINKSYEVVARTEKKQRTTGRFKMTITNARFASSVLVQGKRATPIKGKIFLIVDIEIENPHKVQLYAFPVDLFRFIREDGQKFAPSVHQGAVLVRPEATKKSNVAFVAEPGEKKFRIEVGEIGEAKEILEITF
ncbi:MAG: hypothetical protein A3A57_03235 [Candidatus Woykebacteria bacterium RIFCSPLOWO2_01_FULL_41_12]|uniref:DUF4352 domain-containing protein n=1 Tax=Candidatus Woykebacteria bacterium RIFCSPLOWO2_01_FULL_41_12 TaxID=1802604 RepID=A0A1G1WXK6_9BACT|nr:MAG: hypothetical protein A3A57_03235 [Candidatus Woykebacteria bacterium RIFCSPLOWO2_01_FULL_41_12]